MDITESYTIQCTICKLQVGSYYSEDGIQVMCQKCLIKRRGSFPKGRGCYLPCKKCKPPNVRWFHKKLYGKIKKDCGNHEVSPSESISKLFPDLMKDVDYSTL